MKIACVTSMRSVGCTFVDWSLHFLSNQTVYYQADKLTTIPLSMNPVESINAHGHEKNNPAGLSKAKVHIERFQTQDKVDLCSMYVGPMHMDVAMQYLSLDHSCTTDSELWEKVIRYVANDYQSTIDHCSKQGIGTIYINPDPDLNLYFLNGRCLDKFMISNQKPKTLEDLKHEYQTIFYQTSIEEWQSQGLTNIWDIRERMALNARPFDRVEDRMQLTLSLPHLWINGSELWNHGIDTMKNIMSYLEIKVDSTRWKLWTPIYYQWQSIQQQHLKFAYQFNHIVDAIVNNYYYNVGNLSFDQEVVIQHALIYRHGLNLKTWNLTKFPSNTQDIHKLLEPNIHPI